MRITQEELTQSQIKVSHTLNPEQNYKKNAAIFSITAFYKFKSDPAGV